MFVTANGNNTVEFAVTIAAGSDNVAEPNFNPSLTVTVAVALAPFTLAITNATAEPAETTSVTGNTNWSLPSAVLIVLIAPKVTTLVLVFVTVNSFAASSASVTALPYWIFNS